MSESPSSASSSSAPQTWPEVLTALTEREANLDWFARAHGLHDKLQRVREGPGVARRLTAWISRSCEARYAKSGGTASRLRDEGNAKFAAKDNKGALKLYSESVVCSPKWGPELAWAYGNRSAALYHLGRFEECIQDVELALKHRYPKDSLYKLHQRRGLCLMKLGRSKEALVSLQDALENLESQPTSTPNSTFKSSSRMSIKKKASLAKDIRAILAEVQSSAKDSSSVPEMTKTAEENVEGMASNRLLPGAADSVTLESDDARGRHVIATRNIKVGELLFSERPFCSVLLPEQYASRCHHCHVSVEIPVPCLECTQPRYCSEVCRLASWEGYHAHECGGLDLLNSVGVAHLALRAVLTCGASRLRDIQPFVDKKTATLPKASDVAGEYGRVLGLVEHSSSATPEDLYQYSLTAVLLATYLQQRTKFFEEAGKTAKSPGTSEREGVDENFFGFVCLVLLKHILQLVCNASAIYLVSPGKTAENGDSEVYSECQQRIATALYPSASMMNHSCDPSVVSSFLGARIAVRAVKPIAVGEEVFNCYGPHLRRHRRSHRQAMLRAQYNFDCRCSGCGDPRFDDLAARVTALKCASCEGALRNPEFVDSDAEETTENAHKLKCLDCGKTQPCIQQIQQAFAATSLFAEGSENMRSRNVGAAIACFEKCLSARKSCLYEHNEELVATFDRLAECFASCGRFKEALRALKVSLPSIRFRYGSDSVEYAHELNKYADVLSAAMEELCVAELGGDASPSGDGGAKRQNEIEALRAEAEEKVLAAAGVMAAHYGEKDDRCKEVLARLQQLKL